VERREAAKHSAGDVGDGIENGHFYRLKGEIRQVVGFSLDCLISTTSTARKLFMKPDMYYEAEVLRCN
jgi:hypothetical protein